jgi:hypothetical protein
LLVSAWKNSPEINELRLLPGLVMEGEWQNDPRRARLAILDILGGLPPKRPFWSLTAFVAAIRQASPDFQRPAGDYDSWYIRDSTRQEFLRGFSHWDAVDGALIRYLIAGPMHWLGLVDLAAPEADAPPAAFRLSGWAAALLQGDAPPGLPLEDEPLFVSSDARLRLPRLAPRSVRYQIARFSDWQDEREDGYYYRLTPASLERARRAGLRLSQLLGLLRKHASAVPPILVKALERWEDRGGEARLERVVVLRLSSPELLQTLRSSRAGRYLGDPLGPAAVIVKPGAWEKVLAVLAEMGYLAEWGIEEQ